MSACTYIWTDPKTDIVRYVGCGRKLTRPFEHLTGKRNTEIGNLLKKRFAEGYELKPKVMEMPDFNTAKAHEIFWIAVYGRKDKNLGPLFNRTDGGEGTTGASFKRTAESVERSAAKRRGRKHTEESKALMSSRLQGKQPWNAVPLELKLEVVRLRGGNTKYKDISSLTGFSVNFCQKILCDFRKGKFNA